MKTQKKLIGIIVLCHCILTSIYSQQRTSALLNHDILTIKTEGIAFLGSGITEDDAKTLAIVDAKRKAIEQAGTYLESHTTVLNYQLVKDEIITFSAGLLKVQILNEARELINNMFAFKVYIEATIDIKLLDERIKEIRKDSGLRRQLEIERERIKQLEAKIANLQASGNTASKQEVKKMINELSASEWAEKARYENDWNTQIEYYSKALELDPQMTGAYYQRGLLFSLLRKYEAAIQDYSKVIELIPNYAMAYLKRGNDYNCLGNYEAAINDFNKAIELNPEDADAYKFRGDSYKCNGKYEASIIDYTKAIELKPEDKEDAFHGLFYWITYSDRGTAYLCLKNYEAALKDYSKALEIIPDDPDIYGKRGYVYSEQGNLQAALKDYTIAISLNSQFAGDYVNRGNIYADLGNYEAALRDFTKAIWLDPQHAVAYVNRGNIYRLFLNNKKAAVDDYNSYLRINGNKHGNAEYIRQLIRDLGYEPLY
ncbi:MAG: tetratricopeptide repeat protein [Candidatus Atribacteria bacterium]|nr:tetratricopeptide repeat protein [Candidatus Atribacteria bacterium]